jgi:hypothetical protein
MDFLRNHKTLLAETEGIVNLKVWGRRDLKGQNERETGKRSWEKADFFETWKICLKRLKKFVDLLAKISMICKSERKKGRGFSW